jgi:hypothetical protein
MIMKSPLVLLATLALVTAACAEPEVIYRGEVEAFGWIKQADGTKVNLDGMKFPVTVKRIQAETIDVGPKTKLSLIKAFRDQNRFIRGKSGDNGGGNNFAEFSAPQAIYEANSGTYGVFPPDFPCPSSMDDLVFTSSGINQVWQSLTFAFKYESSTFEPFIIRWRCYKTLVNRPRPQNDFSDEFGDFGVRWNINVTGDVLTEIDISRAVVSSDDTSIFMAQQMREPLLNSFGIETGEGDFRTDIFNIMNTGASATVGTTNDGILYDSDPMDGNYEDTDEYETLEGAAFSNHVCTIKVDADVQTTNASAVNVRMGIGNSPTGNLLSIFNLGDNQYFKIKRTFTGARDTPVGSIEVDFYVPVTGLTSIRLSGSTGVTVGDVLRGYDLFNFTTGQWVKVTESIAPVGDQVFVAPYAGSITNLDEFLGTITHPLFGEITIIRARTRWKNTTFNLPRDWEMRVDQMNCSVTSPL